MTTKYKQGRDTEYLCQRDLQQSGWESIRAAGSKTKTDILAYNVHGTRFIQCKRYTDRPGDFTQDLGQLLSLKLPPNASAELWMRRAGKPGWVERLLIKHTFPTKMDVSDLDDLGNQENFVRPINPDKIKEMATTLTMKAKEERWNSKRTTPTRNLSTTTTESNTPRRSSTTSPKQTTPPASTTETRPNVPARATPV